MRPAPVAQWSGEADAAGLGNALSVLALSLNDMRPTTDLQRTVAPFEVISEFTPSGDQPVAIK